MWSTLHLPGSKVELLMDQVGWVEWVCSVCLHGVEPSVTARCARFLGIYLLPTLLLSLPFVGWDRGRDWILTKSDSTTYPSQVVLSSPNVGGLFCSLPFISGLVALAVLLPQCGHGRRVLPHHSTPPSFHLLLTLKP